MLKKIIGRRDYAPADNIRRMQYNELLREYYKDQLIFDLAKIESTYPNGEREIYSEAGVAFESLIDEYSGDAAHLNTKGSQMVAGRLVEFLAKSLQ